MKKLTENQIESLIHYAREYVTLIDLLDSSPQAKAILGPMMDDVGENDPEMAFGGLDMDRHDIKKLLAEVAAEDKTDD
jgi:hypothetical protein